MTTEQFTSLIGILKQLADQQYTITGAADWPILLMMCGVLGTLMLTIGGMVAYMWKDIKATIKENRSEWRVELDKEEIERKRQDDMIWSHIRECQEDCCPRGGKRSDPR